ncbi:MAG: hypothetical protein F2806_04765 [Actinobacteria bacterium]|uniref:Unannotated protein n=1 Tax=freshwater metagenome TaxID=449393 RepID=A0A6J7G2F0_9ZZZZ|nr:hypothetical protein [Actinomycetota bacterium]
MMIRRKIAPIATLGIVALLLLATGCSSDNSEQATSSSTPSTEASNSRAAGIVTKAVVVCITNGTKADLDNAPTGPYGEFMVTKPGQQACYQGDTTAGDPVAAVTFPNNNVIYVYGRNPVLGRPDIRICNDQDCNDSLAQYDLSVNASISGKVNNIAYTASRLDDAGDTKQLKLLVGK